MSHVSVVMVILSEPTAGGDEASASIPVGAVCSLSVRRCDGATKEDAAMTRLEAGEQAPDFELEDEDGRPVRLADYAGRRVVVYFYPADDTPGCTKEACQFSDLFDRFAEAGVDVLGISPDNAASHRRFREKHGLTVRLLSDPSHETMERYGAWGEKTLYGRKSVGVIRSTLLVGADGRIERAWYHVRADGHAAKVLEVVHSEH
jgi:peroxiredoxin Q/BCP